MMAINYDNAKIILNHSLSNLCLAMPKMLSRDSEKIGYAGVLLRILSL
jgi:hypothetical protein